MRHFIHLTNRRRTIKFFTRLGRPNTRHTPRILQFNQMVSFNRTLASFIRRLIHQFSVNIKRSSNRFFTTMATSRINLTRSLFRGRHRTFSRSITRQITVTIISAFRVIGIRRHGARQLILTTNTRQTIFRRLRSIHIIMRPNRTITRRPHLRVTHTHHTITRNNGRIA